MSSFYYCAGCHRKCRGFHNPCLDCEHALQNARRHAYETGFNEGMEWGVAHPLETICPLQRPTPKSNRKRVTLYMPQIQEDLYYFDAYQKGFDRGFVQSTYTRNIFQHVLAELLLDVGRREAMWYCAHWCSNYLVNQPHSSAIFDGHLLGLINEFF